jgi:hypothetical protein
MGEVPNQSEVARLLNQIETEYAKLVFENIAFY